MSHPLWQQNLTIIRITLVDLAEVGPEVNPSDMIPSSSSGLGPSLSPFSPLRGLLLGVGGGLTSGSCNSGTEHAIITARTRARPQNLRLVPLACETGAVGVSLETWGLEVTALLSPTVAVCPVVLVTRTLLLTDVPPYSLLMTTTAMVAIIVTHPIKQAIIEAVLLPSQSVHGRMVSPNIHTTRGEGEGRHNVTTRDTHVNVTSTMYECHTLYVKQTNCSSNSVTNWDSYY